MPGMGWTHRPEVPPEDRAAAAAQRAAEERLELAWDGLDDETGECDAPELAGPFCGCVTCLVREVLDAAYPHLRALWEADQ